jgi:hypothetical protein
VTQLHGFPRNPAGIALAFVSMVRVLRWLGEATLIIVPIVTSAARIHAHVVDAPDTITQELNQCIRLVNVAASRRLTPAKSARPRPDCHTRIA